MVADSACLASVDASQIDDGSFDPEGRPLSYELSPRGPFPLGQTVVTLVVLDDRGQSDSCTATLTVIDGTPPKLAPITMPSAAYERSTQILLRGHTPIYNASSALLEAYRDIAEAA